MSSTATEVSASARAAREILEELQASGERDRLKEWLQQELTSRGWTDMMQKQAEQVAKEKVGEGVLTARELAKVLSPMGYEGVPEEVRGKLMQELLRAVRKFAEERGNGVEGE